jgi:hypothetical protein
VSRASATVARAPGQVARFMAGETLRMTEFFDTTLPGTLGKYHLVLDLSPRFGDFAKREFVRFPLELRYGLRERCEFYTGFTPFMPNPFDDGPDHRWGPGEGRLGLRYDLSPHALFYRLMTAGLETRVPLGEPPITLIDHYIHVRPYLTASRTLTALPATTLFTTVGYDRALRDPARDGIPAGVIKRHVADLTPGLLYLPGQFGGFVEYSLRHLAEPEGNRLAHDGKLGVLWDVPRTRTRAWGLPGKWQFDLGYKVSDEEGRAPRHGVVAHLRCRTNLKEVLGGRKTDPAATDR